MKNIKIAEDARRKSELKKYGRILSLRPSIEHKAKCVYNRKDKSWKYI